MAILQFLEAALRDVQRRGAVVRIEMQIECEKCWKI
jgi:hypothetical protein